MELKEAAISLARATAKFFEGWSSIPYLCPANYWTIGYGATFYMDGTKVKSTDAAIDKEIGESLLDNQIRTVFYPGAMALCPNCDTAGRKAAVSDFALNLGLTRLKGSTLRRKIAARDWVAADAEILKWNKGGGRALKGLTARCKARVVLMHRV